MFSPVDTTQKPLAPEPMDLAIVPSFPEPRPLFAEIDDHIHMVPGLPGVKCEKCKENGDDTWVVPGLPCGKCGTAAPAS